jgi:acyl-CoA thioesterase FadM
MTAAQGTRWLSSGSLRVRFKGAAYLGDTVETWGRAEKSTDEFERFAIGVRNQSTGEELITGSATVK